LAIERFEALEIPLPPIEEQRGVASHLDRLLEGCAAARRLAMRSDTASAALISSAASRPDLSDEAKRAVGWARTALGAVMQQREDPVIVDGTAVYPNFGILSFGRGTFEKPPIDGSSTSAKTLNRVHAGQFIYSRLFAFEGAYSFVPASFNGWFVSGEFPTFDVDPDALDARWLAAYLRSPDRWAELATRSKGLGLRRQRVPSEAVLAYEIWLPPYEEQQKFLTLADRVVRVQVAHHHLVQIAESLPQSVLNQTLAGLS